MHSDIASLLRATKIFRRRDFPMKKGKRESDSKSTSGIREININDLITQAEAARLRKTTRSAVSQLIRRKRLDFYRVGGGPPMVLRSQVLALRDLREEPKAA
jgi:hypothetical protein